MMAMTTNSDGGGGGSFREEVTSNMALGDGEEHPSQSREDPPKMDRSQENSTSRGTDTTLNAHFLPSACETWTGKGEPQRGWQEGQHLPIRGPAARTPRHVSASRRLQPR